MDELYWYGKEKPTKSRRSLQLFSKGCHKNRLRKIHLKMLYLRKKLETTGFMSDINMIIRMMAMIASDNGFMIIIMMAMITITTMILGTDHYIF